MNVTPKPNLPEWERPSHYIGPDHYGHYVSLAQHAQSAAITRSNFTCALKRLGGESPTVSVIRERHCAVAWVEWIRIHRRDSLAVAIAEQINKELQTHPVLDEDHASELEFSEAETFWAGLSHGERLHFCEQAGLPPSTEEYLPEDPRGALHEILISP